MFFTVLFLMLSAKNPNPWKPIFTQQCFIVSQGEVVRETCKRSVKEAQTPRANLERKLAAQRSVGTE